MPRFDVTGLGTAALDYRVRVDRFPGPDEKIRTHDLAISGGGTIGTALVTVARLGHRAAWAGVLGDDDFGRRILADLEQEGVVTEGVRVVAGARSPFAFCAASGDRRAVFSVAPTTPPFKLGPGDMERLLDTWFLHLDGKEPEAALELAREARKREIGVSLDLQRVEANPDGLLALAELAVVSESFARERFAGKTPEQSVTELYRPGMRLAAITLGARGVVASDGKEVFTVPAEEVAVADTTGAGDVFHGALLVSLLHGQSARDALRFATHVAALSCQALGRDAVPRRDEVGDWL